MEVSKCKCVYVNNLKKDELIEFIKNKEKEGFVLLFVWGTLQIGHSNHSLIELSEPSFYLGRFKTVEKFCRTGFISCYRCDNRKKCDMLNGCYDHVEGDLFLIKEEVLKGPIDNLEGYKNENDYVYNRDKVEITNSEIKLKAYMYFFDCEVEDKI